LQAREKAVAKREAEIDQLMTRKVEATAHVDILKRKL